MQSNLDTIKNAIDYIELHLDEYFTQDMLCKEMGYSKYHFGRLFYSVVGFSLHTYIQRRRLTEAARRLVNTKQPIIDIAMSAGYESQQAFTLAFKAMYRLSPNVYRKRGEFCPIQLKYSFDCLDGISGDNIENIRIVRSDGVTLMGYPRKMDRGDIVDIDNWREFYDKAGCIECRTNSEEYIGFRDFSNWNPDSPENSEYLYFASSEIFSLQAVPEGMAVVSLPSTRYLVFEFYGKTIDDIRPISMYIYKVWFPASNCRLNERAKYDFLRYTDHLDSQKRNKIEYWVPIL